MEQLEDQTYFRLNIFRNEMLSHLPILIASANQEQSKELCATLKGEHCRTTTLPSITDVKSIIEGSSRHVVILDLDTLLVDDLFIKNLRRDRPGVCIICLSSRPFHPELKEAMGSHIFAILSKPVDMEELIYWIRCIWEDVTSSQD